MGKNRSSLEVVKGFGEIIEAISMKREVDRIFIQQGVKHPMTGTLFEKTRLFGIPVQYVPESKLRDLTKSPHYGVVAIISPIRFCMLENLVPSLYEKGVVPLLLMLDRITDVRNFGAITRTAESAGVQAIILPSRGAARINADAIHTSTGALLNIPICRTEKLSTAINFLRNSGLRAIGCTEKAEKSIYEIDFSFPTLAILGSEESGISQSCLSLCDVCVRIPMLGKTESLNVSVAAGIILYEVVRQRVCSFMKS